MPSPFPGVDPYVESRGLWADFHRRVITRCSDALNVLLPDHYAASIDEQIRLVDAVEDPEVRKYLPDVAITRSDRAGASSRPLRGTATLEPATMTIALEPPDEVRDSRIEIIQFPEESVVTVIEILSPTNKDARGRDEYVTKRRKILDSPVHLVEVDLLIRGSRPPMSPKSPWPDGEYYALISRTEDRPDCQVYGWSVRRAVPPVPIPLKSPDPDVTLDLAAVVARVYETGRYGRRLHYDRPLDLPLNPEQLAWAEDLARSAQAR